MDFSFTEEQQMLQDSIRRYLEAGYTLEHRAKAVAGDGWSPTTWRELADLGLLALDVDEADGGIGAGPVGTMLVSQAIGAGLLVEPFHSSAVLATRVLSLLARLNDAIAPEVETGTYEPILGELDVEEGPAAFTARGWCEGFSRGIDLRTPAWEGRLGHDSELMELLGPIIALAIDDGVFESNAEFAPLGDDDYEECLAQIPGAVGAIADYWRDHPLSADEKNRPAGESEPPRRRGGRWVH